MQEEIGKTTNSAVVSYKDLHALGEIKYFVALHAFPDTLLWLFIMFNAQVAALRQAQDRSPKSIFSDPSFFAPCPGGGIGRRASLRG